MKVFADSDGDGSSAGEIRVVASSAQGPTSSEEATFAEPALEPGKRYVARVINFAALEPYRGTIAFAGPPPFEPARTEAWTLTCETPDGTVVTRKEIVIERGQRRTLTLDGCRRGGAFGG